MIFDYSKVVTVVLYLDMVWLKDWLDHYKDRPDLTQFLDHDSKVREYEQRLESIRAELKKREDQTNDC